MTVRRRSMRAVVVLVAGLSAVMGVVVGPATVAHAHAELEDVLPADDALLDTVPAEVTLRFNEHVSLSGGDARVLDDAGVEVGGEPANVDTTITIPLPAGLGDGTYVVSWRAISADSHPISGTSVFHVGAPSADAGDLRQSAEQGAGGGWLLRLVANAATAVLYGAVMVAVGTWWFGQVFSRRPSGEDAPDVLAPLVSGAAAVGIGTAVLWLPLRVARLGGSFDSLTDGSFVDDSIRGPLGAAFAVSMVGLILLLVGLRRSFALCAVGTALAVVGFVFEGHTRTKDPTWAMVGLDAVHLGGGAAWLGGLAGLAVVWRAESVAARRAEAVSRFSSMALWAVGVLAAAGVAMSLLILPEPSALVDTGYGLALVLKVALVAVVVAVGAYNRWRLVPAIASTEGDEPVAAARLVRTVRGELAALCVVLAITAVLVSRSPDVAVEASGNEPQPASVEIVLPDAGTATVGITPGQAGENELSIALSGPGGGVLETTEPPVVELRERALGLGPVEPLVHELVDGSYHAYVDVPFAGTWEVTVRARLDEFTSVSGTAEVTITD